MARKKVAVECMACGSPRIAKHCTDKDGHSISAACTWWRCYECKAFGDTNRWAMFKSAA